jgi:16S rRNA (adenine(1408)-N(1))-methyltransferase
VIVDLGCGDGRAVLAAAAAEPGALVIGIDAAAASMAEASRRAARSASRGGPPNALFLAAGADALDPVLDGAADRVTVLFPWGSLLRGAVAVDETIADAIARLVKPGALIAMLVSVTERDRVPGIPCLDQTTVAGVAERWAAVGMTLVDAHLATPDELAATRSTWAKRLAAGRGRQAWRLDFVRQDHPAAVRYPHSHASRAT